MVRSFENWCEQNGGDHYAGSCNFDNGNVYVDGGHIKGEVDGESFKYNRSDVSVNRGVLVAQSMFGRGRERILIGQGVVGDVDMFKISGDSDEIELLDRAIEGDTEPIIR